MAKTDSGAKVFEAAQQWQPSFPMVVDRIDGTWVVMGWPTVGDIGVTLRLRISFSPDEETALFYFDLAANGDDDFAEVGDAKSSCLCGGAFGEDEAPVFWGEQFREMLRRWATLTRILEPMDEYVGVLPVARVSGASGANRSKRGAPVKNHEFVRSAMTELGAQLIPVLAQEPDTEVRLAALALVAAVACKMVAGEDAVTYDEVTCEFVEGFKEVSLRVAEA